MSLPHHTTLPSRQTHNPLPHPTDKPPLLPRLPPYFYPIDLKVYTPSVPCLHCTLVSSPRCSLLNLLNHSDQRDHKRQRPKIAPPRWYRYMNRPDIPLPIPGLQVRCSRCVRDGIEWCVLREMDVAPTGARVWVRTVDPRRSREGEVVSNDKDSMGRVMVGKKETGEVSVTKELSGVGGRGYNAGGGNDGKMSSNSLVSRARRTARVEKNPNDSVGKEDVDGSSASGKVKRTVKSGKLENPALQRKGSTSLGLPDYGTDSDSENNNNKSQNTDNESNTDPNASDSDAKSNVSSKTSLSKRSIKSTNSTTSPFLTFSSSPPVKKHPESPPPPPSSPPEQTSSENVLNKESSRIWKPKRWEEVLKQVKMERKKWKFNREEWMDHPLFAAVTAVKVRKGDLADLIYPETTTQDKETEMTEKKKGVATKRTPGLKRFFNQGEIPFIAYVRTTDLKGKEEELLQIVRKQILDVMRSYEQTDKRKKEAISAAEGYLPLESRLGGFWTQEDLQRQFALPSWRKRGLEFLDEGLVEMRRRKKEEALERERKLKERMIEDGMIKWTMESKRAMEEGIRAAGGEKEQGKQEEEKGEEEEEEEEEEKADQQEEKKKKKKKDEPKDQVHPSQESDTTNTPSNPPIPSPSPDQKPYTSDPELPPCTPTKYSFPRRRHLLHNFWTKEAQPADFKYAKAIKRNNTFRKWRGVEERSCSKVYRSKWTKTTTTSSEDEEEQNHHQNNSIKHRLQKKQAVTRGKTVGEWVADFQQRKQQRRLQSGTGGSGSGSGSGITATGMLPVPGGTTRRRRQTRQELAETDGNEGEVGGEEKMNDEERILADELADELGAASDASEDEDILRFLGDLCDDDDDVDVGREGEGVGSEEKDGDEDSYPLVDLVRESMMNEY